MSDVPKRRGSRILEIMTFGLFGGEPESSRREREAEQDYRNSTSCHKTITGRSGNMYDRGTCSAKSSSSSVYGYDITRKGKHSSQAQPTGSGSIRFGSSSSSASSASSARARERVQASSGSSGPVYGESTRYGSGSGSSIRSSRGGGTAYGYGSSNLKSTPISLERSQSTNDRYGYGAGDSMYTSNGVSGRLGSSGTIASESAGTHSSSATKSTTKSTTVLCCDKCDGKHETDRCPHFKKARDDHPDAQKNFFKKLGAPSTLPGSVIRNAREVRQPGDGSCLFHSMAYGLKSHCNANTLRAEVCKFIACSGSFQICETPLSNWVKWDSGQSTSDYARRMSRGQWGGGIEMAVCSEIHACNVHVYERGFLGYKRISAFDYHTNPESKPIVRVVYKGGVHYDALVA